jgi:hypothetical protein
MNRFLLSEEITSAFPKLLGNAEVILGGALPHSNGFPTHELLPEYPGNIF